MQSQILGFGVLVGAAVFALGIVALQRCFFNDDHLPSLDDLAEMEREVLYKVFGDKLQEIVKVSSSLFSYICSLSLSSIYFLSFGRKNLHLHLHFALAFCMCSTFGCTCTSHSHFYSHLQFHLHFQFPCINI